MTSKLTINWNRSKGKSCGGISNVHCRNFRSETWLLSKYLNCYDENHKSHRTITLVDIETHEWLIIIEFIRVLSHRWPFTSPRLATNETLLLSNLWLRKPGQGLAGNFMFPLNKDSTRGPSLSERIRWYCFLPHSCIIAAESLPMFEYERNSLLCQYSNQADRAKFIIRLSNTRLERASSKYIIRSSEEVSHHFSIVTIKKSYS